MYYVVDTHALIWYLTNSKQLPAKVKQIFESVEKGKAIVVIPIIVLSEIIYIIEKKKLELKFLNLIEKIESNENYIICPLDLSILKILFNLNAIKEMHDRIIAATAQYYSAPLITKDSEIVASKSIETFW